jgi:hypothetical protein
VSDWEDRKSMPILVPATAADSAIHSLVNRSLRHHTFLCCVSASRDSYCLVLITANAEATNISDTGVRDDIDLMMEVRQPAYAVANPFCREIEQIFLPALEANR